MCPHQRMLIGLVGRRGTGKDTIAHHLVASYNFRNRKFAGPLKDALKSLFCLTDAHVEGPLKEIIHPMWGVSPRAMMQFFGTNVMQSKLQELLPHIGREHAVQRLLMEMDTDMYSGENTNTVVSDVRFQHELDALLKRGAVIVQVKRTVNMVQDTIIDAHESEAGVDDLFSHVQIENNGSLECLLLKVDQLISEIFT